MFWHTSQINHCARFQPQNPLGNRPSPNASHFMGLEVAAELLRPVRRHRGPFRWQSGRPLPRGPCGLSAFRSLPMRRSREPRYLSRERSAVGAREGRGIRGSRGWPRGTGSRRESVSATRSGNTSGHRPRRIAVHIAPRAVGSTGWLSAPRARGVFSHVVRVWMLRGSSTGSYIQPRVLREFVAVSRPARRQAPTWPGLTWIVLIGLTPNHTTSCRSSGRGRWPDREGSGRPPWGCGAC